MISHVLHGSLLKKRPEILNVFIHFKNMVENQLSPKIKILRTEGGGGGVSKLGMSFLNIFLLWHYSLLTLPPHSSTKKVFLKKESIDIWSKVGYL